MKPDEEENEYTKIVDYQPLPTSDDKVVGIYDLFQKGKDIAPKVSKPYIPPPKPSKE